MTISESETASLKFHLGYGSIGVDAEPYVDFYALFEQTIAPNLTGGAETSIASAIIAGVAIVTPASMTGIVSHARLVVDAGTDVEAVTVKSVTASTFTARFTRPHAAGCPVAVMGGVARLRMLLQQADTAFEALQDPSGATAGLSSVDKGDVVFQPRGAVLRDRLRHYQSIQSQLGSLCRVTPRNSSSGSVLSVY